jgi:hypothetical protein
MKIHSAQSILALPGNVIWVRLADDTNDDDASTFADMISDKLPDHTGLIVTTDDLVKHIGVLGVPELMHLRGMIDAALSACIKEN